MIESIQAFRHWITRVNALVQVAVECETALAEARARRDLYQRSDDKKAAATVVAEIHHAQRQYDLAMALCYDATGTQTLEQLSRVLTDVRMGLANATEFFEAWRKAELLVLALKACDGFATTQAEGLTEAEALERAHKLHQEYQVTLTLVSRLIPVDQTLQ